MSWPQSPDSWSKPLISAIAYPGRLESEWKFQESWLRRIIQQDETGCGVACVAIFANVGYDDARKVMFGRARGTYTSTADLRRALCRFGFKPARRLIPFGRRGRYTDLREDAVLKLKAR